MVISIACGEFSGCGENLSKSAEGRGGVQTTEPTDYSNTGYIDKLATVTVLTMLKICIC